MTAEVDPAVPGGLGEPFEPAGTVGLTLLNGCVTGFGW